MPDETRIALTDASKTYEIWDSPLARLQSPCIQRASRTADALGFGRLAGHFSERADRRVRRVHALEPVSLEVRAGEAFGILGRNGSGKSTLLQLAAGTVQPTAGRVRTRGRISALLQLGSGFNPEFTGRENVYLNAAILGVTRAEARRRFDDVLEFADIGEFIDCPLRTYSSGMQMRLAFAVQVMLDPEILIIDEALAVGDIFFQQKCFARLRDLLNNGTCVLFVSHSMTAVQQFCDRALVLDQGSPVFLGDAADAVRRYQMAMQQTGGGKPQAPEEGSGAVPPLELNSEPARSGASTRQSPDEGAWSVVGEDQQDSTGSAFVRRLVICDERACPKAAFEQGEVAHVWYEIEALEDIERPSAGVALCSHNGELIHAKHLIQTPLPGPERLVAGQILRVCQTVALPLMIGEYTIEAAMISVPPDCWKGDSIDEQVFNERIVRHAWTRPVAPLYVIPQAHRTGHFTSHYGLVDLEGEVSWEIRCVAERRVPDPAGIQPLENHVSSDE